MLFFSRLYCWRGVGSGGVWPREGGGWRVLSPLYILNLFERPFGTGVWGAVFEGLVLGFVTCAGVGCW